MTPTKPNKKTRAVPRRKVALTYSEWTAKLDGEVEAALAEIKREGRLPAPPPIPAGRLDVESEKLQAASRDFTTLAKATGCLNSAFQAFFARVQRGDGIPERERRDLAALSGVFIESAEMIQELLAIAVKDAVHIFQKL